MGPPENNKKRKLENVFKQYELRLNEAEKQIKECKNIIGIKLFCYQFIQQLSKFFYKLLKILLEALH
jgi:hypothetical protein